MNRFEAKNRIKEATEGYNSSEEIRAYTQKYIDDHADLPRLVCYKVVASELNADFNTTLSPGDVKQVYENSLAWNEPISDTSQPVGTEIANDKAYVGIITPPSTDIEPESDLSQEFDNEDIEDESFDDSQEEYSDYPDIQFGEDDYNEWPDEDELEESIKLLKANGYKITESSEVSGKYMQKGIQFGTDEEIEKEIYDDFATSELKKVRPKHSSYEDEVDNLKFEEAKKKVLNSNYKITEIRGPKRRIVKQDDTYSQVYNEIEDLTQITKHLTYLSATEAAAEMYHTTPDYAMNIAKDVANDYMDDESWKIQNNKYRRKYPITRESKLKEDYTPEQENAIEDISSEYRISSERPPHTYIINRLIGVGISEEEAEEIYSDVVYEWNDTVRNGEDY
jgi:hypothetical protein